VDTKNLKVHFLLGFERSGTTLLSQILNAHPQVISPPENLFLLQFYNAYKNKTQWQRKDIDFLVDNILWEGMKSMHLWGVEPQHLKQALYPLLPNTNYSSIVKVIYTQFQLVKEKPDLQMIVDKNNPFAFHFDKLQSLFPKAKFIFLVRDYRGVFLSRKEKKVFYKSKDAYISGLLWKEINEKIYHNLKNKLIIKYEDLVHDPQTVLQNICTYLEIAYDEGMFDYQHNLNQLLNSNKDKQSKKMMEYIGASLFKPIDKNLADKWQHHLSEQEVEVLDGVCQPFAGNFNYALHSKPSYPVKKPIYDLLHYHLIFKPLMRCQFSKIFSSGLLKRFIHK